MGCCGGFLSGAAFREVTVAEAQDELRRGALLVDVRETTEWEAGHAPDAVHRPLSSLPATSAALPGDRTLVVVCRSGNRSARATEWLRRRGLDAVHLQGGMGAWAAAGHPVVTTAGHPVVTTAGQPGGLA